MRDIDMERVNGTREKMLETVKSPVLTHEQKVAAMANLADSLLEVVDLPEGLHDLMDQPIDSKCFATWQRVMHRFAPVYHPGL